MSPGYPLHSPFEAPPSRIGTACTFAPQKPVASCSPAPLGPISVDNGCARPPLGDYSALRGRTGLSLSSLLSSSASATKAPATCEARSPTASGARPHPNLHMSTFYLPSSLGGNMILQAKSYFRRQEDRKLSPSKPPRPRGGAGQKKLAWDQRQGRIGTKSPTRRSNFWANPLHTPGAAKARV